MAGFIPDIWASKALGVLKKRNNLYDLTNRSYETNVKSAGGSVIVPVLDSISVKDETSSNYKPKTTNNRKQKEITLSKRAIVTMGVSAVNQIQSNSNLIDQYTKKAGLVIGKSIDRKLAKTFIEDCEPSNRLKYSDLVSGATKLTKTVILGVQEKMNEVCGFEDRYLVVDPKGYKALGEISDFVDYQKIAYNPQNSPLRTGVIGMVYGFQVFLMPSLPDVDSSWGIDSGSGSSADHKHVAIFYQKEAFATVIQAHMKAKHSYDADTASDIVQLITVYGAELLEPNHCVVVREN